jgi:hypothetical protein
MRAPAWLAIAGAVLAGTAQAQTKFSIQQITLPGATSVDAAAISDTNEILGNEVDGNGEHGFILKGAEFTLLPSAVPGCAGSAQLYPTGMNLYGTVAGAALCDNAPYLFLYQNGAYTGTTSLGAPGSEHLFVGIDDRRNLVFNYNNGGGSYTPYITTRSRGTRRVAYPEYHALVRSVNDRNQAAGTALHDCGIPGHCVFTGNKRKYRLKLIYPPGAATASGGYINNRNQVAGVYATSIGGDYTGFVYDWNSNTYTTFNAPGTAYTMNVYGNNQSGRVVGIYAAQNDTQHGFLYNGSTVTSFGSFPAGDTVTAAINKHGVIVVSDTSASGSISYIVKCSGTGC